MLSDQDSAYLEQFKQALKSKCLECQKSDIFGHPACLALYRFEFQKVQANIPTKYRAMTLLDISHPQLKESKAYIQDYIDNLPKNFAQGLAPFICGQSGLGKTSLGCIVLKEALKQGHTAYFTKLDDCINLLTSSWHDDQLKQEFNNQILSVEFLMIDDLGDELRSLKSNLVVSTLNKILRTRLDNLRPTILTTNTEANELRAKYDHRIYSILKEHTIIVPCSGIDYREHIISPKINPQ